jgi:hypothetical protein
VEFTPSPQQLLFLWCVVIEPPGTPLNRLSYKLSSAESRKQLERFGWITVDKVAISSRSKPMVATLTENGWYGLEQNLNAPIARGAATAKVLHKILAGIQRNIEQGRLSLADICSESLALKSEAEPPSAEHPSAAIAPDKLKRRLYDACRRLVGNGIYGVRIRLADLRTQLPDVPRVDLDQTLQDLESSETAALYPLDDPREIGPDDIDAALSNSSGRQRHVLYLSRPR